MNTVVILDGIPRSGSTFFSRIIDAFPGTCVLDDPIRLFHYYVLDHEKNFSYPRSMIKVSNIDFNSPFKKEHFFQLQKRIEDSRFLPELKRDLLRLRYKTSYTEICSDICEITRNYFKSQIVGFQVTHHHRFRNAILDAMPDVKWITIVRDPRGVYASAKLSHKMNIQHVCRFWNDLVESLSARERFLCVRYEDLILRTEDTIASVASFLNVDLDLKKFLKNIKLKNNIGKPWFSNSSFGSTNVQNTHVPAKYFDKKPVKRWEDVLNVIEKYIIWKQCASNMSKMEYGLSEKNKGFVIEFRDSSIWLFRIFLSLPKKVSIKIKFEISKLRRRRKKVF